MNRRNIIQKNDLFDNDELSDKLNEDIEKYGRRKIESAYYEMVSFGSLLFDYEQYKRKEREFIALQFLICMLYLTIGIFVGALLIIT